MLRSILPTVTYNISSGPFKLVDHPDKTNGTFEVPGLTFKGEEGQSITVGGFSQDATIDGKSILSLGDTTFSIVGGSWKGKGEEVKLQSSVKFQPNVTICFEGTDTKEGLVLSYDNPEAAEEARSQIESEKGTWKFEKVEKEDDYDTAGLLPTWQSSEPPRIVKWSTSLTFSVKLDLQVAEAEVKATRTYTVSLGMRPVFEKPKRRNTPPPVDPKQPPSDPPDASKIPVKSDEPKVPVEPKPPPYNPPVDPPSDPTKNVKPKPPPVPAVKPNPAPAVKPTPPYIPVDPIVTQKDEYYTDLKVKGTQVGVAAVGVGIGYSALAAGATGGAATGAVTSAITSSAAVLSTAGFLSADLAAKGAAIGAAGGPAAMIVGAGAGLVVGSIATLIIWGRA